MALLDTGSLISIVRAHPIPQDRPVLQYTSVAWVYRQVCKWPVVKMSLGYNNNIYQLEVLKVDDLLFPILFSRGAPAFGILVRAALPRLTALVSDDEEPGLSNAPADV